MEFTKEQIQSLSVASKKLLIRELYGGDCHRYFKDLVYTLDEHDKTGKGVKKIPYEWLYIQNLIDDYLSLRWIFVWKSRQIMCTWVTCAYLLWLILFHKGKKVAIQSKKSDDADALIQRMKVIYDHLPAWKPVAEFSYCRIKVPENYSDAFGVPQGPDQLRSYTFTTIFSDEYGFQEKTQETFAASKPAVDGGGQFIAVTTPPKVKNFAYACLRNPVFQAPNGKVVRIHYSARPDRGPDWVATAKIGWTEQDWNRENELTFSESGASRIYHPFNEGIHVNPNLIYNSSTLLYRGWDFGFHRPAVVFSQIDGGDRYCDLYEILGRDLLLDEFAQKVVKETQLRFPNAVVRDFCDVAGNQKSDKTDKTSIQLLKDVIGHFPESRKCGIEDGHNILRKRMNTLIGGRPAYQIHPSCVNSIDGYLFGYVYRPDGITPCGDTESNEDGEEEKDYYKHLQDARRYIVQNIYTIHGGYVNQNLKPSALPHNPFLPKR